MKLVTYLAPGGEQRGGVVAGEAIVDLADGARAIGTTLPGDVLGLLREGPNGLAVADKLRQEAEAGGVATVPIGDVTLTAALPNPPKVLLLAGNYQSHIMESGAAAVDKSKITPRPFIKPGTAVIGPNDSIEIPPDSDTLDYEIEIAAVIGTRGKQIPVERAEEYVAGYMVFNDISARSLKIADGRSERNGDWFFDWLLGKWCDGFAAVGPYLVTKDEAGEPGSLEMALSVNGELRQHSSAGEMIFTIPEAIAFISRFVTLEPGDLLAMGTPGGVGDTTQTYLKAGDVVEAKIEKLGTLVNKIVPFGGA